MTTQDTMQGIYILLYGAFFFVVIFGLLFIAKKLLPKVFKRVSPWKILAHTVTIIFGLIFPPIFLIYFGYLFWKAYKYKQARDVKSGKKIDSSKAATYVNRVPNQINHDPQFIELQSIILQSWERALVNAGLSRVNKRYSKTQNQQDRAMYSHREPSVMESVTTLFEDSRFAKELAMNDGLYQDRDGMTIHDVPRIIDGDSTPYGAYFVIDNSIVQIPLDEYNKKAESLSQGLFVTGISFTQTPEELSYGEVKMHVRTKDPLDQGKQLEKVTPAPSYHTLEAGIKEDGTPMRISLSGNPVIGVVGATGSGKTASMMATLLPLALRPDVQFFVIDGKGENDWLWLQDRAVEFYKGKDVLPALDVLIHARNAYRARTSAFSSQFTDKRQLVEDNYEGNFWNRQPDEKYPLIVLIVDEATPFLIGKGKAIEEFRTEIKNLASQSRSGGLTTFIMTQGATAEDWLPMDIRQNMNYAVHLRANSKYSAPILLPELADHFQENPADNPISFTQPGLAIARSDDSRKFNRFRFNYVSLKTAVLAMEEEGDQYRMTIEELSNPLTDSKPTWGELER